MPIEFSCPACHQLVRTPDATAGKKGKCPQCGAIVQIPAVLAPSKGPSQAVGKKKPQLANEVASVKAPPAKARQEPARPVKPAPAPQPAPEPVAAPAAPPIEFPCVWCGELVRTPATAAGKRGRCPHCQRIVKIPKEVSRPARSTTTGPDADLGLAEEALERATPAPSALKHSVQRPVPAAPARPKPPPKSESATAASALAESPSAASPAAGTKPVAIKVQEATPITDLTPPPPDPLSGLAPLAASEPEGLTPLPDLPPDSFSTLTPLTSEPLTVLTPLPEDDPLGLGTAGLGISGGYGAPIAQPRPIISDARRRGLPWEREPSLETFGDTVKLVIAGPHDAFGSMRRSGGIGNPLGFLIVTSVLASMLLLIEFFLLQLGMVFYVQAGASEIHIHWDRFFIRFGIMAVGMLFSALFGAALGGFINALILHLGLLMFGGANAGFEATYRVVAFGTGAVYMLLPIPLIGPFFASVMYFVVLIYGLMYAHETSGGRAVLAVLVPLALATCCMAPVLLMFGSLPVMLSPMGRN